MIVFNLLLSLAVPSLAGFSLLTSPPRSGSVDSAAPWIPLGVFGMADGASLTIHISPTSISSSTAYLIALTSEQIERYWQTLFISDDASLVKPLDLNRPALLLVPIESGSQPPFQITATGQQLVTLAIANPFTGPSGSFILGDFPMTDSLETENSLFKRINSLFTDFSDPRIQVSYSIKLLQPDGSQTDLRDVPLPASLLAVSVSLLISMILYSLLLRSTWRGFDNKLHTVLVVTIAWLSIFLSIQSVSETISEYAGKVFDALEVAAYLLSALGWKILRNRLTPSEWRMVGGISGFLLYVGFFEVGCESDGTCASFRLGRLVATSVAYLVVIIGVNFHAAHLTAQIRESSMISGPAVLGRLYQKLDAFVSYRRLFLAFLLQPTIAVYFRLAVLSWQDDWGFAAGYWLSRGALLMGLAWVMRPRVENLKVVELMLGHRGRH